MSRCDLCGAKNPAACPCTELRRIADPVQAPGGVGYRWEPRSGIEPAVFERALDDWLLGTV